MNNPASHFLVFRLDPPDTEGTEVLTFIVGGQHRGGMAEGRMSWTGGLSAPVAELISARVQRWLCEELFEQQLLAFIDPSGQGVPPTV